MNKKISFNISTQFIVFGTILISLCLLYLYCSATPINKNTVITIVGSGLAAYIGAFSAFNFEKNNKEETQRRKELTTLKYVNVFLKIMISKYHNHAQIAKQQLEIQRVPVFVIYETPLQNPIDKISFLADKDFDLLENTMRAIGRLYSYEEVLISYNSVIEESYDKLKTHYNVYVDQRINAEKIIKKREHIEKEASNIIKKIETHINNNYKDINQ
ncbi:hypothetical protein [Maridesulfovibrio sp.]|uniref:hypothetical protein n=1 Tax=Maridesulfovibrio sp. TaxID=2795000 RepID=UPI003BA9F643